MGDLLKICITTTYIRIYALKYACILDSIVGASLIVITLCRHMAMGKQLYSLIFLSNNFLVNYVHHVQDIKCCEP